MQTHVFDRCASRYDSLVDTIWGALSFTEGECYVCGFGSFDFQILRKGGQTDKSTDRHDVTNYEHENPTLIYFSRTV